MHLWGLITSPNLSFNAVCKICTNSSSGLVLLKRTRPYNFVLPGCLPGAIVRAISRTPLGVFHFLFSDTSATVNLQLKPPVSS